MHRRSALLALPFLTGAAAAQELPARPLRLIVPFTTGGTTDILARILAEHAQAEFGQPLIVESRPGAGGVTGTAQVAAAPPDGTTLVMGTPGPIATAPALMGSMPYDPLRDLAPVMLVANVPNLVVVNPASGLTSIAALIAAARARPGAIHFGSAGIGATTHLAGELFKLMTGVDIVHVPYRGSAPALQDLMGGRVQLMVDGYSLMRGAHEGGRLRVLAITSATRHPQLPDVPTIEETGLPWRFASWQAIVTPTATPPAIRQRLEDNLAWIFANTDLPRVLTGLGTFPQNAPGAEVDRLIREDRAHWTSVVREAGISAD